MATVALSRTEQLEKQVKTAERRADALQKKVDDGDAVIAKLKGQVSDLAKRYGTTTGYAVGGAVIGGGAAYLFHDDVVEFFGADSWMGYLTLPAIGALALYAAYRIKDPPSKPGARLDDRVGLLGLGLGLLLGGGYMSYTTWPTT